MQNSIVLPPQIQLEPGERVLSWSVTTGHTGARITGIVFGLLLAIGLVGLLFIYKAITYKKWKVYDELVTDRRFIQILGDGATVELAVAAVSKVTTIKQGAVVKSVRLESSGRAPMYLTTTSLGGAGNQVSLADFVTRRGERGFLASLAPTGRAAKLAA